MNDLLQNVLDALEVAERHAQAVSNHAPDSKPLGDLHLAIRDLQRKARNTVDEVPAWLTDVGAHLTRAISQEDNA